MGMQDKVDVQGCFKRTTVTSMLLGLFPLMWARASSRALGPHLVRCALVDLLTFFHWNL